jgi:predicted PhzF superfamily epimerase YddE/YHI9
MPFPLFQVDAFTDRPFAGNPAAVCLLDGEREAEWMQNVAREMNLSETAFLVPRGDGCGLRWFTPAVEVDLCGHATLASAHTLWEAGYLKPDEPARFHTRSGLLTCVRCGAWIEMDFPADPARTVAPPEAIRKCLGAPPRYVGRGRENFVAELDSEATVRALKPDLEQLMHLGRARLIVTSRATTPGFDFVSRFFAPSAGVNEDPVTGSAHCLLAPFWAERLGKPEMVAYQASARGGIVRVKVEGDRVRLRGQAVTILRGELLQQPPEETGQQEFR